MWESSVYRSIFAEGQAEAEAENSAWERRAIINLLRRGLDVEAIAEAMEMSVEKVEKIQLSESQASTLRESSVYRSIFAEGFTKGFPEGFARGLAQANAIPEVKGADRGDRKAAIALLWHNINIKIIAKITGLSIETIQQLKKEI
jgi:predicted transposase YdaD